MNVAQSIEPNVGETVIWRHSGAIPPRSDKEVSRLKWVYVIISLVWLAFWFSRPSTREALLSKNAYIVSLVFFVSVILISLALASVVMNA